MLKMNNIEIRDGMDHIHMLVEVIGKRPTGFEGEKRAAEYIHGQLEGWGLEHVAIEPFECRSWDFSLCQLTTHDPDIGNLEALPVQFSAPAPKRGLTGEVVYYEDPADVDYHKLRNKIVFIFGGMGNDELLVESGAIALITSSSDRPYAINIIYGPLKPAAGKLPMVSMGYYDAMKMVKYGVRRVTLHIDSIIKDVVGLNVAGKILPPHGYEDSRRLNVSAHYDSVPASGAAADNACGTACALEVARVLAQAGISIPVDIAFFSAEEIGLYGSYNCLHIRIYGLVQVQEVYREYDKARFPAHERI